MRSSASSIAFPRTKSDVALRVNVVTIFPEFFSGPLGLSIPSRAAAAGSVRYNIVDLRNFTHDRHRTVDDYPYGGGAGMVMKPQPFFEAGGALKNKPPIVLLSPRGRIFAAADGPGFASRGEPPLPSRRHQGHHHAVGGP